MVEHQLPDELPGSVAMSKLLDIYMAGQALRNKRLIQIHIQTGDAAVLVVNYQMPVAAAIAPLFGGDALMAHVEPTFRTVTLAAAPGLATAEGFVLWDTEFDRVEAVRATAAGALRRTSANVLAYWGVMRPLIYSTLEGIYVENSSSSSSAPARSSSHAEPVQLSARLNSDPRSRTRSVSSRRSGRSINRTSTRSSRSRSRSRRQSAPTRRRSQRKFGTPDPNGRRRSNRRRIRTA